MKKCKHCDTYLPSRNFCPLCGRKRQTAAGGGFKAERPDPPVAAKWECRARNASGTILLHGGPYGSRTEAEAALAKARRRHPGILRHSWVQEVEERK